MIGLWNYEPDRSWNNLAGLNELDWLSCICVIIPPTLSLRSKRFQSSYCANFFCSCPSFLDEPREETLATQANQLFAWHHNKHSMSVKRECSSFSFDVSLTYLCTLHSLMRKTGDNGQHSFVSDYARSQSIGLLTTVLFCSVRNMLCPWHEGYESESFKQTISLWEPPIVFVL